MRAGTAATTEKKTTFRRVGNKAIIINPIISTKENNKIRSMTNEYLISEAKELAEKRNRCKRISGLLKFEMKLDTMRNGNAIGYSTGKIHDHDATFLPIRFSSDDLALKAKAMFVSKGYLVRIDKKYIHVNIETDPDDMLKEMMETVDTKNQTEILHERLSSTLAEAKEIVEKSRTQHLSAEQIASRIMISFKTNKAIVLDGNKKISDIFSGGPLPVWGEDMLVELIKDALK